MPEKAAVTQFTIADVEQLTGISKHKLRMWERRYGFPDPGRDPRGERVYNDVQVRRLREIKRLLDQGFRPGKVIAAGEPRSKERA